MMSTSLSRPGPAASPRIPEAHTCPGWVTRAGRGQRRPRVPRDRSGLGGGGCRTLRLGVGRWLDPLAGQPRRSPVDEGDEPLAHERAEVEEGIDEPAEED